MKDNHSKYTSFFSSGNKTSLSPFLTPFSQKVSHYMPLLSNGICLILLILGALFHYTTFESLSTLCLLGIYLLAGTPAITLSIKEILKGSISVQTLMSLSAFSTLYIGSGYEGALLLTLFALSHTLEDFIHKKAFASLQNLEELQPQYVTLVKNNIDEQTSIFSIKKGDIVAVKVGETIPLDGILLSESGCVSVSHITGESLPHTITKGCNVIAGSIVVNSQVVVRVSSTTKNSTLSKITHLIHEAKQSKPEIETFFDRFTEGYSIVIITFAALLITTLYIAGYPLMENGGAIYRGMSFLIVASPCALLIGAPTAYISALSSCAKNGIVIKGAKFLDTIAHISHIAFDKTGTITTGDICVSSFVCNDGDVDPSVYDAIVSLESTQTHPLAISLAKHASSQGGRASIIKRGKTVLGKGVSGLIGNNTEPSFIGSRKYIQEATMRKLSIEETSTHCFVFHNNKIYTVYFTDTVRCEAESTISQLKTLYKLTPLLLTGDIKSKADDIANLVGIHSIHSELSPEDKLDIISSLSSLHTTMMIGDGMNDAPALAKAHASVSIGEKSSATATKASDIIIIKESLSPLLFLFKKAYATQSIVKQNITAALLIIIITSLASIFGYMPLTLAVILHEGSTVAVGLNSLRLLR